MTANDKLTHGGESPTTMNAQQPTEKSGEAVRSIELLPCPWCGGEAKLEKQCNCWLCRIFGTSRRVRCIICDTCKTGDTADEAIKRWQHRWQGNTKLCDMAADNPKDTNAKSDSQ